MQYVIYLIIGFALVVLAGYLFEDLHIKTKENREAMGKISQDLEELKNKKSPDE